MTHDIRVYTASGVVTHRYREGEGGWEYLGVVGQEGFVAPPPAPVVDTIMPDLPAGPGYTGSLDDWVRDHGGMTAGDLRDHPTPDPFNLPREDNDR